MNLTPTEEWIGEVAMTLWEDILSRLNHPDQNLFKDHVEGVGYCQMRMDVLAWVPSLIEDWASIQGYDMSFDWDFVPEWVNKNVVIDEYTMRLSEDRHVPSNA